MPTGKAKTVMDGEARGEELADDAVPSGWLEGLLHRWSDGPRSTSLVGVFWLISLAEPLTRLLQHHPTPLQLGSALAGLVVFAVVYVWMTLARAPAQAATARSTWWRLWSGLAVLTAIAIGLAVLDGPTWLLLVVFVSVRVGAAPPSVWPVTRLVWVLALLVLVLGILLGMDWYAALVLALLVIAAGFITSTRARLVATIVALHAAQREIARLAADAERLRVARDLHDLLGHTLSLLALKSELAGRLVTISPERAAAEIREVESISRTALQEVREAVAGYRQPTLASELHAARELLTAAGIEYALEGAMGAGSREPRLPTRVETVVSWAVREGVTNVIRHSRARWCHIRLTAQTDAVCLTVTDGGQKALVPAVPAAPDDDAVRTPASAGSGLAGLRERVTRLDGRFETGPEPHGGFRLFICLPLASHGDVDANAAGSMAHAAPRSQEEDA